MAWQTQQTRHILLHEGLDFGSAPGVSGILDFFVSISNAAQNYSIFEMTFQQSLSVSEGSGCEDADGPCPE